MPAITAPTQPRRHRQVTIAPAIITPQKMEKKAWLNLSPKMKAATEPVQAPVAGSGIATNNISPMRSYFLITVPRRRACLKTQLTSLLPISTLQITLVSDSKNNNRIGTGSMLPITAKPKAWYQGM